MPGDPGEECVCVRVRGIRTDYGGAAMTRPQSPSPAGDY